MIYSTYYSPSILALANLNHDRSLDIIVASSGNREIRLLFNIGNGSFTAYTSFSLDKSPRAVTVADMNGDENFDLIIIHSISKNIAIFFNTGNGTFSTPTVYQNNLYPNLVAVGDVNNDHKLNIIVTTSESRKTSSIDIFFNTGNGIFTVETTYSAGSSAFSVAIADINDDHQFDIIVGYYRRIAILFNNCN
ncbi:unnamed protein product [Rotaria sp. Silwood1]|nr:unnamed protein product [Rotaria sp. Silwood1]